MTFSVGAVLYVIAVLLTIVVVASKYFAVTLPKVSLGNARPSPKPPYRIGAGLGFSVDLAQMMFFGSDENVARS